ncbi:hypothetical protein CC_1349 [Caulobacter vibrioides CB15]|uniref:Uncharacterized protein n=1 Tax=Caulobacter vibrioides (strain ATCC 19089 / CIP 103742 / CB 15) TaxID=190650 RepID=Q9A8K4_CAUVC|nr:hypothetical protein CC_1349 [Caulobacter vibrioides CB15]
MRLIKRVHEQSPLWGGARGQDRPAVQARPDLRLAEQVADHAALGAHRPSVEHIGGADQSDPQGGNPDTALERAVVLRFELAEQLLADQGVGAGLARVGLGLGAGPHDDAARGRAAVLDLKMDRILRIPPDAIATRDVAASMGGRDERGHGQGDRQGRQYEFEETHNSQCKGL